MANLFSEKVVDNKTKIEEQIDSGFLLNAVTNMDPTINDLNAFAKKLGKMDRKKGRAMLKEVNQLERDIRALTPLVNNATATGPGDARDAIMGNIKRGMKAVRKDFRSIMKFLDKKSFISVNVG